MRLLLRVFFTSLFLVTVILVTVTRAQPPLRKSPLDLVNVFTGTSNSRWMMNPGACVPFGMVKYGPDNQENVWNGGYEYTIGSIGGFSHLHEFGLAGLSLMPATGKVEQYPHQPKTFMGTPDGPFGTMWTAGYRSRYRKQDEAGSPGYYAVSLLDAGVRVELTATTRCGLMRCTFPQTDESRLLVDFLFPAEEKFEVLEAHARRVSDTELAGSVRQRNQYADEYTVYFVIQFSEPFRSVESWETPAYSGSETNYGTQWRTEARCQPLQNEFKGRDDCGLLVHFGPKQAGQQVSVRTGLSLVSVEGARQNMKAEMERFGWNFAKTLAEARTRWGRVLDRVNVSGGTAQQRATFYTNLYRAYVGRSVVSDADGQYRDACGKVQQAAAPADALYSSDSFWGTQWNLIPLWTLLTPDVARSWIQSFLEMYDKGGWMADSPTALKYAPVMGSQHHNALLVSAFQKKIGGFDVERAYAAMRHDLTTPGVAHPCGGFAGNRHLAAYDKLGYVPDEVGAVSNTVEYAYDDWMMAQFAKALGKTDDYGFFMRRSAAWQNVYDSATHYIRRKHQDGRWVEPFDPHRFGTTGGWNGPGYMEGTAWIYTFFVPHDLPGLIRKMGRDRFNQRLEEGFVKGFVDLTNQPNLQAPFLFNYSGKPWLTQQYSRQVLNKFFDNSPYKGWEGEEDEGQMSAFYCLLAMGLFEMDAGCSVRPYYDLGSPLFSEITLNLPNGRRFTIEARGNSAQNVYIQSATLNGRPLNKPILYHDELMQGGRLVLQMNRQPNVRWGGGN
ncbi:MAG: GH92 family glycosyl hydrolase [Cytophagales bacterium]|nr:GH92 family glycosyl hydrolase [Cytophagales bacterium]